MDAPLYPPSEAYEAPRFIPSRLDTVHTPISTLLANPAALAILERELPGFKARVSLGQLQQHLTNFSPRSLVTFGLFQTADLDRIDPLLRALPVAGAR